MNDLGIRPGGSQEHRVRALEDLAGSIGGVGSGANFASHHQQQHQQQQNEHQRNLFYNYVFKNTADLLDRTAVPADIRQKVWRIYRQLISGHAESLGPIRYLLFEMIRDYDVAAGDEDIPHLIDFLMEIEGFLKWLIETWFEVTTSSGYLKVKKYDSQVQKTFLRFLINLIKYNAACIASSDDSKALIKMIRYVCALAYRSGSIDELKLIYEFLNVVLSYSHLPKETLSQFVEILCIGVNREELYETCSKIMRNLIGTHLGFACLTTLHYIIEDEINFSDKVLIRGAVYFLVQALWGDMANEKVSISANTVLTTFKNLLAHDLITGSPYVVLEISTGIYKFISLAVQPPAGHYRQNKPPLAAVAVSHHYWDDALHLKSCEIVYQYTWDLVLNVCDILVSYLLVSGTVEECGELRTMILLIMELLEKTLLSNADNAAAKTDQLAFLREKNYIEKVFAILEHARDHLKKETICNLIEHRLNHINEFQFDQDQKTKQLKHVIVTFFISNANAASRSKCLEKLENFLNDCTFIDVDVFWEKVAAGYFLSSDANQNRDSAMKFLLFLAKKSRSNKNLNEFIEIFDTTVHHRLKVYVKQNSLETPMHNHNRSHYPGPMIHHQTSDPTRSTDSSPFDDAIKSINGLITIFSENIDHIYCHVAAVNAFRSLVKVLAFIQKLHTEDSHHQSSWARALSLIKRKLFHTILSLRTNRWAQLGVVDNSNSPVTAVELSPTHQLGRSTVMEESVRFTPYILVRDITYSVTNHTGSPPQSPQRHSQPVYDCGSAGVVQNTSSLSSSFHASFVDALKLVIDSINSERDWSILELILSELPKTLKHKGLILAATSSVGCGGHHGSPASSTNHLNQPEAIPDLLVKALCNFIESISTHLQELHFGGEKVSKVDIYAHIYNSISALVGYKLLPPSQSLIVKCLQNGLVYFSSKTPYVRQCIVSLTICSMEMKSIMSKYKILQDILIQLSKITTNKHLAVPQLEFLSNIILFPELYSSFIDKEYLSIFMIAQSYINPNKYGEYTVALALRVISMWFLKCPIQCRTSLIPFLMKGFKMNILKEESRMTQRTILQHHKLENRISFAASPPPPPSTPLTHTVFSFPSSSHADHPTQSASSSSSIVSCQQLGTDSVILDPHDKENSKIELVEVCMDMLAINAFTTSSPLPLKPSMIDRLLNKEKTQYWMIGHKIIQITTTGCTSRAIRNGLCHKCYTICHMNKPLSESHHSLTSFTGPYSSSLGNCNEPPLVSSSDHTAIMGNSNNQNVRRRHRSEMYSSTRTRSSISTNDDCLNSRNKHESPSETRNTENVAGKYCRCWCQNWAEILIRRATGTTRVIMRVENNLGDFPHWSQGDDHPLAQLFKHSDNDLALKFPSYSPHSQSYENVKNGISSFEPPPMDCSNCFLPSPATETGSSNSGTKSSFVDQKAKTSQPVNRAASFGSRSTSSSIVHNNNNNDCADGHHEMARNNLIMRKLEKDLSFEEITPPDGSQTSLVSSTGGGDDSSSETTQQALFRDRGHTISVMSPAQNSSGAVLMASGGGCPMLTPESPMSSSNLSLSSRQPISPHGLSPKFVFLQLYYNSMFGEELPGSAGTAGAAAATTDKPIHLEKNEALNRSLNIFDRVTPYETHKIGVLYVGPGQANSRSEILANQMGSYRYAQFLNELGQLIPLDEVDPRVFYVGGLDATKDGPHAISWCDHLVQMIFHVATMMPTLASDPQCNNKMAHIGNDLVCIIYNNSGEPVDLTSLKERFGRVLLATVMIMPLEYESNIVQIQSNKEFAEFIGHTESQVLSDQALPVYVRQLALHANLGAMVYNPKQEMRSYHISNWLSRLRNIKRVRLRAMEHQQHHQHHHHQQLPEHTIRGGSVSSQHSNTGSGGKMRQSSSIETGGDSSPMVISSSSGVSPNPYTGGNNNNGGSANSINNNNSVFDYGDALATAASTSSSSASRMLTFPDFIDYTTKE